MASMLTMKTFGHCGGDGSTRRAQRDGNKGREDEGRLVDGDWRRRLHRR